MIKLLRANFFKLFCSWSFWLTLFILPFINIFVIISGDRTYKGLEPRSGLDRWNLGMCGETCFSHLMFLTYIIVLLMGMFIGDEYASGALRNKIIAGYSRTKLYFSYLIAGVCESLIIDLFCIAVPFTICCIRYGFDGDWGTLGLMTVSSLPPVAALTAFTILCIIFAGDRTSGMVIAFLTDLVMYYFFDWFFLSKLINEPEKVSAAQKKLYLLIDALLPSSFVEWLYAFGMKAHDLNVTHAPKCGWCCITLAVMTAAGLMQFRKNDLK